MEITALDWFIIVAYFVLTLGIGLLSGKQGGQSLSDYFISGRALPWWISGTSMVATTFAADTPLAVTGIVAANGVAGNWVWWSLAMGGMFTVFVYAKLWRRAEVMTDVELIEVRYSGSHAAWLRGLRAVYIALIINPIIIGWVTGAMLTILKETVLHGTDTRMSQWTDWGIIIVCLAVVGVYSAISGLWGVALADFMQFFTAMGGCIIVAVVAVGKVGGVDALREKVIDKFGNDQVLHFLPSFGADNEWMPLHVFLIFLLVQWWATWYPGAEPGGGGYIVQRMAACKDERHAVLATLWYQLAHYCLRPWPWLMVAFVALVTYPEIRQLAVDEGLREQMGTNAGAGYAWVIRDMSPPGLRGLMLVTFFAAFMSTISTQMNWGASYLMRDVYQRFWAPNASDQELISASRWISVLVLFAGGIASYLLIGKQIDEIWKVLLALGAGTGGVYILRWFWWRINAWTEIVAMLGSLVFYLVFSRTIVVRDEVLIVIVAAATICAWLVATWVTPPDDQQTLVAFYKKVRPAGPGWKPIAALAPEVQVDRHLGLSILASIVASAIVYLTLPGIGYLIFGNYLLSGLCLGGAVICGFIVMQLMRTIGWQNVV